MFDLSFSARNVLIGATLLGAVGGVIGCFALLRRQSLLGDALAHAALPGVCIAFLLTASKGSLTLFLGALVAGLLGALVIVAIVRTTRIKEDSAIGIVLSVFFGVGIVLLTMIQKSPTGNQSGLDKYLFGQAAALMEEDLRWMAILGFGVLGAVFLFFKEFQILTFDREFAATLGFPVRRLEAWLTLLLVVVVVVGLQTVGVVLMVATLLTPAAAARQWTDRLGAMLLLAGAIGASTGAVGAYLSSLVPRLPTGPTIVLASSSLLVLSLLFAPQRGLLGALVRERRLRSRIRRENLLKDLWIESTAGGAAPPTSVSWPRLMGLRGQSRHELDGGMRRLTRNGLVETGALGLRLTEAGRDVAANVVRKHRLWEVYLSRRLDLPPDHVHRDADAMEHALSDDAVESIDALLGHPETDPHGQPIPRPRTRTGDTTMSSANP